MTDVTEISVKLHWHLLKSLRKIFCGQKSLQFVSIQGKILACAKQERGKKKNQTTRRKRNVRILKKGLEVAAHVV